MLSALLLPRTFFLLILGLALLALGAAFTAQLGFGIQPCILCLYERVPYAALLVLGALGAGMANRVPAARALALLVLLAALVSLGLACYHIGVERHWWAFGTGCPISPLGEQLSDDPAQALQALLTTPTVRCDKVSWVLLGAPATWWNMALSLVLTLYAAAALRPILNHHDPQKNQALR